MLYVVLNFLSCPCGTEDEVFVTMCAFFSNRMTFCECMEKLLILLSHYLESYNFELENVKADLKILSMLFLITYFLECEAFFLKSIYQLWRYICVGLHCTRLGKWKLYNLTCPYPVQEWIHLQLLFLTKLHIWTQKLASSFFTRHQVHFPFNLNQTVHMITILGQNLV